LTSPALPKPTTLPSLTPFERQGCIFYSDQGGYQATNESNSPLKTIYFIGVIDIFTKYDRKKKWENFFKGMIVGKEGISCAEPNYYADRFMRFIRDSIGGDGGGSEYDAI
jgi:1-phosphatidylinositol-4-phosphate 5-kinase